jgi:hypothetical protein
VGQIEVVGREQEVIAGVDRVDRVARQERLDLGDRVVRRQPIGRRRRRAGGGRRRRSPAAGTTGGTCSSIAPRNARAGATSAWVGGVAAADLLAVDVDVDERAARLEQRLQPSVATSPRLVPSAISTSSPRSA